MTNASTIGALRAAVFVSIKLDEFANQRAFDQAVARLIQDVPVPAEVTRRNSLIYQERNLHRSRQSRPGSKCFSTPLSSHIHPSIAVRRDFGKGLFSNHQTDGRVPQRGLRRSGY